MNCVRKGDSLTCHIIKTIAVVFVMQQVGHVELNSEHPPN